VRAKEEETEEKEKGKKKQHKKHHSDSEVSRSSHLTFSVISLC